MLPGTRLGVNGGLACGLYGESGVDKVVVGLASDHPGILSDLDIHFVGSHSARRQELIVEELGPGD